MRVGKHKGHIIVAACFMIQAVGVGTFVTYGVFFNSIASEMHWSRATIAGASSLSFILSGIFAMVIGGLNDRYGPRNLMRLSAILLGTGVLFMSRVTEIWQLYFFYGILFGIGLGAIDVIALTTTARWFSSSRGFMTGIVKVGTGAGQFLIPFLASLLIAAYGWRQAYLYLGVCVLFTLFGIAQVLRRDRGDLELSRPTLRHLPAADQYPGGNLTAGAALRTIQLWILCGVSVLIVFCLLTVLVHIVPHARDLGLSPVKAAGVLSTIGAVSMVGRFCTGVTIDKIGSKPIMVICFVILIAGLLWLQVAEKIWMLYFFAAVYGLAHGGFFTAISPIVAEVFGIAAHGAIFGIVVFAGTAGGAAGPLVAGQLFDSTGSYTITFKIITLFSIFGLILITFLRPIEINLERAGN